MSSRRRSMRAVLPLAALLTASCSTTPPIAASPPPPTTAPPSAQGTPGTPAPRTTDEGVFSQAQVDRGRTEYATFCTVCHSARSFRGIIHDWDGLTVGYVTEVIKQTMPEDSPASLRDQQYLDIVVYMLSLDGVTPGDRPLRVSDEGWSGIRIQRP